MPRGKQSKKQPKKDPELDPYDRFDSPDSSSVKSATYFTDDNLLVIHFGKTDTKYKYMNFKPEDWQAFKDAPSKGKFVHSFIVPNYKGVLLG